MPTERSPLLQNVPVAEPRQRYPHHLLRRVCTILLTVVPVLALAVYITYIAVRDHNASEPDSSLENAFRLSSSNPHLPESQGFQYEKLKEILRNTPDARKAREWSAYYTAGPHLAGKNLSQAEWTRDRWAEWGVDTTEVVAYEVYINYPRDHRLALLQDGEVEFEATLEEDVSDEDPTSGLADRVPTFHGYSASGNVTAPFVFVNYGTYDDYEKLVQTGIDLKGKIAIAKYGGIFRGLKVKRASELGMVGVVMYSDPGDDGDITELNGYETYPQGPARNPSSVQRGSVQYLSIAPGDPTTPGYPSKPGVPRSPVDGKIPDIPSLPISYLEALPILKALNGHGPNVSTFPATWQTGGLGYKGVAYNIGPSPDSVTLNLYNDQEYVTTPLWNAIGIINGTVEDEVIVIGNHRDAWIAGGAGDPNSGSAALNEVVRSFSEALAAGWKPHRTIVFASWDGEEYGLVGSTEWVEEYIPWLSASAVAYINVDVGTSGRHFTAAAAPLLNQVLYETTQEVQSPNQTIPGQTIRDLWNGHINTMGSGSDYTAFQDFAGIPCVDLGFKPGPNDPIYHYHSNYDSFHWMDDFGDVGFEYHATIAQTINLLAAELVERPIIHFNASDYAHALGIYVDQIEETAIVASTLDVHKALSRIRRAVGSFEKSAAAFQEKAEALTNTLGSAFHTLNAVEKDNAYASARAINTKYKYLERQFLYEAGLDQRDWFKHVVFAPGIWTGYAGKTFPGLVEALEAGDEVKIDEWAKIITEKIYFAAASLLD